MDIMTSAPSIVESKVSDRRDSIVSPAEDIPTGELIKAPTKDYKALAEIHRAKSEFLKPAKRIERFQQLRLFEQNTVLPNIAAKTGLFAPVKPGRRKFLREYESVPVWGLPGVDVAYKHEQLNQLDLNVYLLLVSFARRQGEMKASFTRREALKTLRMNDSGFSYKVLDKHIDRLGSTRVQIAVGGQNSDGRDQCYVFRDALAPRDYQESRAGLYVVELSSSLQGFFKVDDWTIINLPQRLELGQNQWALAVHAFLSTWPKRSSWFKWGDIHRLWGHGYSDLSTMRRDFRRRVLKPLFEINFLSKVEEKPGNTSNPTGSVGMWCRREV